MLTLVNNKCRLLEFLYDNQINILNDEYCPLSQKDMANYLKVTRPTINILLKSLRDNELIEDYSNKKYKLTNNGKKYIIAIKDIERN